MKVGACFAEEYNVHKGINEFSHRTFCLLGNAICSTMRSEGFRPIAFKL